MKRIIQTLTHAGVKAAQAAGDAAQGAVEAAYSQTVQAKVAQGATELSNALFTGHAYSPYTADTAAHRAQYQAQEQSHDHGQ